LGSRQTRLKTSSAGIVRTKTMQLYEYPVILTVKSRYG
jgi:hypothetical protein